MKEFSGTAEYSINFEKPDVVAANWLLDLGEVKELATVILNGKKLATLIGPTYTVIIPASLLKPINQLQVIVTNGMANRVIDLDKRGVQWKKFYNINMSSRLARIEEQMDYSLPANGRPKPSGLLGPVKITPLKPKQ